MAYWITQFDTTAIAGASANHDIGIPEANAEVMAALGGAFDTRGSEQVAAKLPYSIQVQGKLVQTSVAALLAAYQTLRALHGKRAKLYRTADGGTANGEWVWARLMRVETSRKVENRLALPFTLTFMVESPIWHGTARSTTITLSSSPATGTVTNSGNATVRDAIITVTAAGSAITVVDIENTTTGNVSKIRYTGAIPAGQSLVIDCGARSVKVNGADAYAGFSLQAAHAIPEWLRLAAGANSIRVTRTGGGTASTCTIAFDDGWA
jgi:hypothetical protein